MDHFLWSTGLPEHFILHKNLEVVLKLEDEPIDKHRIHVKLLDKMVIFSLTREGNTIGVENFHCFFKLCKMSVHVFRLLEVIVYTSPE